MLKNFGGAVLVRRELEFVLQSQEVTPFDGCRSPSRPVAINIAEQSPDIGRRTVGIPVTFFLDKNQRLADVSNAIRQ